MSETLNIYATAVALGGAGVLLRGPSGAGKSDLALRLIDAGGLLIADDRVDLTVTEGKLLASPPASIAGLLEVRGVGIVRFPWTACTPIALVVDLARPEAIERLPSPTTTLLLSVRVPSMRLDPWPASAVMKLRLAVNQALLDK
jgi:HPr kinase/phosphorylase